MGLNLWIIKIIVVENVVFYNVFDGYYVDIYMNIMNFIINEVLERWYVVWVINCDINKFM